MESLLSMWPVMLGGVFGVVWLVRLEGRINTGEALRKVHDDRLANFERRISDQLDRIESKLDGKADK
jgi:hypothetical protein